MFGMQIAGMASITMNDECVQYSINWCQTMRSSSLHVISSDGMQSPASASMSCNYPNHSLFQSSLLTSLLLQFPQEYASLIY